MSIDYPSGDGKPDCEHCHGRGVVSMPSAVGHKVAPCTCVYIRDLFANVDRGWRGLSQADKIPSSPLMEHPTKNCYITAPLRLFRAHLRHVAVRSGPNWGFVVVSDADLMDSWLARVDEVYDADVDQMRKQPVTSKYGALVDLIEPAELLVILTGVKAARNKAMPEVLLETLKHREYLNLPTWVVDQPEYILADGHISYDIRVGLQISNWPHVTLTTNQKPVMAMPDINTLNPFHMPETPRQIENSDDLKLFPTKKKWGSKRGARDE